MNLEEALGIDSYKKIKDLAKKRQIVFLSEIEKELEDQSLQVFIKEQYKLDLVKQLQDLETVIEILGLNRIESSTLVYKEYTIKQLAENVYSQLLDLTTITPALKLEGFTIDDMISQSIPLDIKNQLGTLL